MGRSSAILELINRKTEEKIKLEEKINKLKKMIAELSEKVGEMTSVQSQPNGLKDIFDKFISSEDYSFGTLLEYMEDTARNKENKFIELNCFQNEWIEKYKEVLEKAEKLLSDWYMKLSKLEEVIRDLWTQYYQALAMGD